ncbi:D-2-hydroxyacid dehydrogenase [Flavonifractor sp. DFI.6.63]|uniref:D-2-hydroxyacid dehydrogenase n=1 Tax=Flavonifractor sp. DFI.6.63 TaxID=2963704 RepID=UPI0021099D1E|nr:D-2-hydroxyacid dehydrogenase [Flavonifractor sp. DFI.6.63]MCQ5028044.1 D-2-hydroxyacid dehydrogenase [Flavonifractor sp. DFI.6.63]
MDVIVMHANSEKMPLKIRACHLEQMHRHADHVYYFKNEEELLASGADAEVLFAWGGTGKQPETFCRQSRRLKWFNSFSAGVNPLMECGIKDLDIIITNAAGIHGKPMGVTTMGYVISYLRKFPLMLENQKKHIRQKPDALPEEPEGKTLGIVGAGAIGSEVAKYAKALGFRVIGVKRRAVPLEHYDRVYSNQDLDLALGQMDFVVILTPLTQETRGLFDAGRLAACKPGAYLINIARGPVVETAALIQALRSGHLGGCALDAIDEADLPADSPLWDMPNVFLTPQYSATSPLYVDRAVEQFLENLDNFRAGRPLFNVIDVASLR